jgi:cytidine deaminase
MTVVYGFDKNFLPYSFVRNQKSTGFEVEVLEAVFDGTGIKLETRPMQEWERVQAELSSNVLQVSSGMTRTELREKLFIFPARPTFVLEGRFFTRPETRAPRAEELRGNAVSVKKDSLYHRRLENFGGFKISAYPTDEEALNAMWIGETRAYFGPGKTAYHFVEKNDWQGVAAVGLPVSRTEVYYAFYKGKTELRDLVDRRLGEIRRNGVYDEIYRKWFVDELTPQERDGLIKSAAEAASIAFALHSGKGGGAALLSRTGEVYTGSETECADPEYGVSALAAAVSAAVSAADTEIRAAAVVDDSGRLVPPEPSERALLQEFGRGVLVLVEPEKGEYDSVMISRLMPYPATGTRD